MWSTDDSSDDEIQPQKAPTYHHTINADHNIDSDYETSDSEDRDAIEYYQLHKQDREYHTIHGGTNYTTPADEPQQSLRLKQAIGVQEELIKPNWNRMKLISQLKNRSSLKRERKRLVTNWVALITSLFGSHGNRFS